MIAIPSDGMREIEAALALLGLRPRRITLISPLKQRKGSRCAYRVEAEDGRILKARQLETREQACRLLELRTGLEEAFAPVLAQYGSVLLEEWIDGVPLTELDSEARAEDGGALLGRLHARALHPGVPVMVDTEEWCARALSDLEILSRAEKLASAESAALQAAIQQRNPGTARAALTHNDFCAENMLIDARGHLRVIDNERLAIAPAGFDVGRTFDRWPMSEDAWACFRRGYRSSAPADVEALGFWKIVAALVGARVRYQRSPERLDAALALLRRFAAGRSLL